MRKPRYAIRDNFTGRYLREAERHIGQEGQLYTHWTNRPEKALRFPGLKTARRMADRLGGDIGIVNMRGETLQ